MITNASPVESPRASHRAPIAPTAGARLTEMDVRYVRSLEESQRRSAALAHDLNNLLSVVTCCSDLILSSLPPGHPLREMAMEVAKAGERSAALTRQFVAGARERKSTPLNVNAAVEGMAVLLRRMAGPDVTLTLAPAADAPLTAIDREDLERILMNLCVNARDAMPSGGRLAVGVEAESVGRDEVRDPERPGPGDYVVVSVADTGCGIPPEIRDRLFERHFTTKGEGEGSGLGLATVHDMVRRAGGHVGVMSRPGRGTTFRVYLPRVEAGRPRLLNRAWSVPCG